MNFNDLKEVVQQAIDTSKGTKDEMSDNPELFLWFGHPDDKKPLQLDATGVAAKVRNGVQESPHVFLCFTPEDKDPVESLKNIMRTVLGEEEAEKIFAGAEEMAKKTMLENMEPGGHA